MHESTHHIPTLAAIDATAGARRSFGFLNAVDHKRKMGVGEQEQLAFAVTKKLEGDSLVCVCVSLCVLIQNVLGSVLAVYSHRITPSGEQWLCLCLWVDRGWGQSVHV